MGILKNEETNNISRSQTGNASVGGFNAILDQGSEFEGKLTFQGTVRIDGSFKGEIFSKSHIVIGQSGRVDGDAKIGSIAISGQFFGNINAKEKVELHSSAVVEGDITTPSLMIEDGVQLNGKVNMNPEGATVNTSPNKSTTDTSDKNPSTKTQNGVGATASTTR